MSGKGYNNDKYKRSIGYGQKRIEIEIHSIHITIDVIDLWISLIESENVNFKIQYAANNPWVNILWMKTETFVIYLSEFNIHDDTLQFHSETMKIIHMFLEIYNI